MLEPVKVVPRLLARQARDGADVHVVVVPRQVGVSMVEGVVLVPPQIRAGSEEIQACSREAVHDGTSRVRSMIAVVLDVESDACDGKPHRNTEGDGEPDPMREKKEPEV